MDKLKQESVDLTEQNIDKIGVMFPNVITETKDENGNLKKAINFALLKQMLSKEVVDGDECYEFTWVGKKQSIIEGNTPIRKTLRPCKEESKDWDTTENLYIEGDNLEVLKLLQGSYLNAIKMIYIDPPYNTGNDFVYRDNFAMSKEEYDEESGLFDEDENRLFKNSKTNGRYHSDWCSMMYPRLQLARNLLTEDGVIFISIDDNEVDNLRKICDEIFGEVCFVANTIWRSSDNSNNDAKQFSNDHNYTLIYSKKPNWQPLKQRDEDKNSHFKNPDNDPKGPYFDGNPLNSPNYRENLIYDIITPKGNIISPPKNGWRWSKETLDLKIKSGEIRFNKEETAIRRRTYLYEMEGLPPSSLWIDLMKTGHNRQAKYELLKLLPEDVFDTPKPVRLIKYILSLIPNSEDSIILDFFSGSGTTADAVMQLNKEDKGSRKFILVQLPEDLDKSLKGASNDKKKIITNAITLCDSLGVKHTLSEISKERIRRVGYNICQEIHSGKQNEIDTSSSAIDIGFRVLKLDTTNMKDVYYSPAEYSQQMLLDLESNIKEDRTDLDLLFGVLVNWGVPLSLPLQTKEIEGKAVHFVNDTDLVACFEENISESLIREVAKAKPMRVVFRDSSFANSPDKINVTEIFKTISPDTTIKVI